MPPYELELVPFSVDMMDSHDHHDRYHIYSFEYGVIVDNVGLVQGIYVNKDLASGLVYAGTSVGLVRSRTSVSNNSNVDWTYVHQWEAGGILPLPLTDNFGLKVNLQRTQYGETSYGGRSFSMRPTQGWAVGIGAIYVYSRR